MNRVYIIPDANQEVLLQNIMNLCLELWNMTITQRRNKYSWGKTSLSTHERELLELKEAFPEYRAIHHQVLMNVFIAVEEAYQDFMPRRRQKGVRPPALKSDSDVYTLRYTGDSFIIERDKLQLKYANQWLVFDIPKGDYLAVNCVDLGYDEQWWIELKN